MKQQGFRGSVHSVVGVCAFLAIAVSCIAPPPVEDFHLIVVDMPHGGRRIAIERDGSGTYAYGALPAFGRFGVGTFDFRDVYEKLQPVAPAGRRESSEEYGTVQFLTDRRSESALYFVYDRALVEALLAMAFESREEPENAVEHEMVRTLDEIWLAEESEAP